MNILGFNSTHDASAALVRDGEIVLAVEEERLSRVKHHYGFPDNAIRECLEAGGIDFKDLDHVAFYWNPWRGVLPFAWHVVRHLPRSLAYFDHQPGIWGRFRRLPELVAEKYGYDGPFHFLDHHPNHIASSFWPSGFSEAAALSVDGTGEWETTALARIDDHGRARVLQANRYPHSLGKLWETVTQYLGFSPNSGEGKVMGLAPYGRPALVNDVEELVEIRDDGRFRLNLRYFDFQTGRKRKYSDRFVEQFGPPRVPESPIEERHEDLAFALQALTENLLGVLARRLFALTGCPRLVMAGGVALNSVANGKLLSEGPFTELFVQPSAGDAGAALGAALRVWHEIADRRTGRHRMEHAYLGPEFGEDRIVEALEAAGLQHRRCEDAPGRAARCLVSGRIVGWFQGRAEYGPRALGNRSILADPRDGRMKDVLNARVKHREGFRPFAPSVLAERAEEFFEMGGRESPFMLQVHAVRDEARARIPAVTHVDGTARVQTVRADQNPRYHALIEAFGRATGVPVVLNTSFNVRGEPIVHTPEDAITCFLGTELDDLFLGDLHVEKPSPKGE